MLSRAKQNAIVDIFALISFIPSLFSGIVLFVLFPGGGGFRGGRNGIEAVEFLGLTHAGWRDLHNYSSLIFAALIIIHLLLHWRYFRNLPRCLSRKNADACRADTTIPQDE